jgi:hypothetical protein
MDVKPGTPAVVAAVPEQLFLGKGAGSLLLCAKDPRERFRLLVRKSSEAAGRFDIHGSEALASSDRNVPCTCAPGLRADP